jgi:hypothetical protein
MKLVYSNVATRLYSLNNYACRLHNTCDATRKRKKVHISSTHMIYAVTLQFNNSHKYSLMVKIQEQLLKFIIIHLQSCKKFVKKVTIL